MKKLTISLLLASLAKAGTAYADDTSLEGLLSEEVVTSVSKSAQASHDAPALTRSISAEEIRRYGMTSVDEAIDFLGVGAHVEHSLGRSELTVRGIAFPGDRGNHVLILVDGHIANEPLYGDADLDQTLGVPLELIDHIELVLGPGSAVYGSNAVLGVVNVVTKSASSNKGFHVAGEVSAVGTQRMTFTTGQSFEVLGKRASLTTGFSYFRQRSTVELATQDLVDVSGRHFIWGGVADDSNRIDVPALYARFVRDRLEVTARAVVSASGDPTGIGDFDHPSAGTVERRSSIGVNQSFALGRVGDLSLSLYGDAFANRRRSIYSRQIACPFAGATCDYREDERSNRVGTEARTTFDWLHDGRLVTALGVTASWDHVSAKHEALDYTTGARLTPVGRTVDIDSIANLAANGEQTLRPFHWVALTAGARVDWRKIFESDGDAHTFEPVVTPRLALTTTPWSGATAKVLYAEAFRAPNPYELDATLPTLIRSNPLVPERTSSAEAIFEQRLDSHRFMFGVFSTNYRGIINRILLSNAEVNAAIAAGLTPLLSDANTPIYQYRRDDQIQTHGFNAGVDGTLLSQRLRYGASFTGTIARADSVERVLLAPQVMGNARTSYDLGGRLPTLALAASFSGNAVSDRSAVNGFVQPTLAPPSLELRFAATGDVPWVKGLSYRVIVAHQFHDHTPFAVGPALRASDTVTAPTLAPSQPWNATVGLQYDFGQ